MFKKNYFFFKYVFVNSANSQTDQSALHHVCVFAVRIVFGLHVANVEFQRVRVQVQRRAVALPHMQRHITRIVTVKERKVAKIVGLSLYIFCLGLDPNLGPGLNFS